MIKMKLSRDEGPLYVFGLSDKNIEKLKEGLPIKIRLSELGEKGEVLIFVGSTEEAMMRDLEKNGLVPAAAAGGTPQ